MRTTIRLPDDLHEQVRSLSRDSGRGLSDTIVMLLRRSLGRGMTPELVEDEAGLLISTGGPRVTSDDVRSLDDDD